MDFSWDKLAQTPPAEPGLWDGLNQATGQRTAQLGGPQSGSTIPAMDDMAYSVLEEKIGKDNAGVIKSLDNLMQGPYYKDWLDYGRGNAIEQFIRDQNKNQYPPSRGPTVMGIG